MNIGTQLTAYRAEPLLGGFSELKRQARGHVVPRLALRLGIDALRPSVFLGNGQQDKFLSQAFRIEARMLLEGLQIIPGGTVGPSSFHISRFEFI